MMLSSLSSRLAAESGWYEGDEMGRVGYLERQLFSAKRLAVDTGLHAKGWTRQQAIDFGIEPSEVDRYIVNPGQACAYMIGQLEIIRLRDFAKDALKSSPRRHSTIRCCPPGRCRWQCSKRRYSATFRSSAEMLIRTRIARTNLSDGGGFAVPVLYLHRGFLAFLAD